MNAFSLAPFVEIARYILFGVVVILAIGLVLTLFGLSLSGRP